eukprot:CAMPEP_0119320946 /NCGR_PEP_ID=MMETSP1333-20130426/53983_1 /TAXON_ID=418940 /ORGANISM="Scyphosphaera apsteinii, Strain RCC1455" /LENGTH=333 /DNA_ID=CAMNT_0007327789 /DNA_START=17 /DNA_END=1018 /DNA_ORIENTATION=+
MPEGASVMLFSCFTFWYLGNYYYNIFNKLSVVEAGGKDSGLMFLTATAQLVVGALYALAVWLVGHNPITFSKQPVPKLTQQDVVGITVLAFWSAIAHAGSVFALTAGSIAFGQIVKAAEPVFAAVLSTLIYKKPPSAAKAMTLPIIILGVCIACLKPDANGDYKVEFDVTALIAGSIANIAASFRGSENARLMTDKGLKDRIDGVGNQFALAQVIGSLVLIPIAVALEGYSLPKFVSLVKSNGSFAYNLFMAGMTFYGYNELSTMTIKYTSAVTMSVANTAKRVIVIVGVALAFGKPLTNEEIAGSVISISGVFIYSIADMLAARFLPKAKSA